MHTQTRIRHVGSIRPLKNKLYSDEKTGIINKQNLNIPQIFAEREIKIFTVVNQKTKSHETESQQKEI